MYLENIKSPDDVKKLSLTELVILASEARDHLIKSQARTGGHVGANCGVVELTVALHYVFDSPRDVFIWDVGHQVYIHKMLTGRLDCMHSMRQDGGSPGFPCRSESEHDPLDLSHGGTSLSLALGNALANRLKKSRDLPIAIIGDSALGEGMALEALNQIGYEKPRMLIVLNDNGWGITENKTAISNYLKTLPLEHIRETFFSSFGIKYIGPLNGHDIETLVDAMQSIKDTDSPVVLHARTIKGFGLPYADKSLSRLHFSFPFDLKTGNPIMETEGLESNIFYKPVSPFNAEFIGKKIEELALKDSKVIVITPATIGAAEVFGAFRKVPERSFDVGMAEQNALTLAVGFSLRGMKPIVVYQSTFFQRAFDQLVHDACANDVPVILILARSGLAGLDHTTHHAVFDLSYLRCVPNLEIYFPSDHRAFNELLDEKVNKWVNHPTAMLFPYGTLTMLEPIGEEMSLIDENPLAPENSGIILTTAGRLKSALSVKKFLLERGVKWGILNITKIKPLDEELLNGVFQRYTRIVTIEENVINGGFGSAILEFASDHAFKPDVIRITLGDMFVEHGTRPYLYRKYSIDEGAILARIKERWPGLFGGDHS